MFRSVAYISSTKSAKSADKFRFARGFFLLGAVPLLFFSDFFFRS